jgi:hypothetical protein
MDEAGKTKVVDRFVPLKERQAFGRNQRNVIRRVDHANWNPPAHRGDPIAALLVANRGRQKELLPLKWRRMSASPFAFFRGAAPLMAADLALIPTTGITVQLCGDAHVLNLGAYAAPDGNLVFDRWMWRSKWSVRAALVRGIMLFS